MRQEERTVYICDHCKRKMFVKSACKNHEENCVKNPDNFMACINCKHCKKIDKTIWVDTFNGNFDNEERQVKGFFCEKLTVGLYPVKALVLVNRWPENFADENLMPRYCEHHESAFEF